MSAASTPTVVTQLGSAGKRSIGDVNMEIQDMPLISGDTTATITASALSRIDLVLVIGATLTSVPVVTNNTATIAFIDPAATVKASIILLGR